MLFFYDEKHLKSNTQPIKVYDDSPQFLFYLPIFKIHNFKESFLHCSLSLFCLQLRQSRTIEYTYLKGISPAANNG